MRQRKLGEADGNSCAFFRAVGRDEKLDKNRIFREAVARKILREPGDLLMAIFAYFVENDEPANLIGKLHRIYDNKKECLTPEEQKWVDTETELRAIQDNPFDSGKGEVRRVPAPKED